MTDPRVCVSRPSGREDRSQEMCMKRTYEKPTLTKRGKLSAVTAIPASSGDL